MELNPSSLKGFWFDLPTTAARLHSSALYPFNAFFSCFFFPSQIRCANPTHVRMVARVSGLEMTLTASALQGTEEVFAMLVNTTLLSRGLIL